MLDAQNAVTGADMNNRGKGSLKYFLQQREIVARFVKGDQSTSQKKGNASENLWANVLPCGPAPEANLSAQKNHVLMEDSKALSYDTGKVQLVPGSSSSPPEPDKTSGIQIVENPSDSVYRKTSSVSVKKQETLGHYAGTWRKTSLVLLSTARDAS